MIIIRLFLFFLVFSVLNSQEKKIAEIHINGLKKTKEAFIKHIIKAKPGQTLDSLILNQDIARLKRLPLVSHAYYQVFYSHDNTYNLFYYIEENFTLIPNINIWTATNQQFAYKIGVYDFNFLGKGINFGGFYQNNGYNSYGINFRAPYLFSRNFGLALNHLNWQSIEPLYFASGNANYLYNNKSFEFLGLFECNTKHKVQAGVNFFTETFRYLEGTLENGVPTHLTENKILLKLVYDFDTLNYYYQYLSGFRSLLYLQSVQSENEFQPNFFIAWNDFYYYKRIGAKGNWANRLRLGLSSNSNSPFAPFSVDNNLNIRGVGNIIDRGTGVIVINTEYRYTLYEKKWFALQGNVFIDAGSWRNPGGNFSNFVESQNLRIYPGIGFRFIHKKIYNAIFRVDYGYGVTKNASRGVVFGIGQYF